MSRALVFDTETTGLIANHSTREELQPEVIEFFGGEIDLDDGKTYDGLELLVRPTRLLPDKIVKITGITDAMLADAPGFFVVAKEIRDLVERQSLIIAHNLSYDKEVIDFEFERRGITRIAWPPGICTVEATLYLRGYRLKLGDLYEILFDEKFADGHRARADVAALARCCLELRRRKII